MLDEVVGHGAIFAIDLVRPCHIATQIGGFAFEGLKLVIGYE